MRRVGLPTIALAVAGAVLTACAGTTSDTTDPTDTQAPTTAAVTTTTSPVGDGAEGSGCTPGEGDLPEGEWYGEVSEVSSDQIEFDLACWFTGEAAARAATEDGEESPPPNDYYVRNVNTTVRSIPVGDNVMVVWYPEYGDPTTETTISFDEWRNAVDDRGDFIPGIWIEIEDGVITDIREQWVP